MCTPVHTLLCTHNADVPHRAATPHVNFPDDIDDTAKRVAAGAQTAPRKRGRKRRRPAGARAADQKQDEDGSGGGSDGDGGAGQDGRPRRTTAGRVKAAVDAADAAAARSAAQSSSDEEPQYWCNVCKDDAVKPCAYCGCKICKTKTNFASILLCDHCDGEYHTNCLVPPLTTVPDDDWYCHDCVANGTCCAAANPLHPSHTR